MKCEHNIHVIVKHVKLSLKHALEPDAEYNLKSLNYRIHRGAINPQLPHKLYSTVNILPILAIKAAIDCSYHELHGDIQIDFCFIYFINVDSSSHF